MSEQTAGRGERLECGCDFSGCCGRLCEAHATALWDEAQAAKARRAESMPDDQAAIRALFEAHLRLRELGWRDTLYAPRDTEPVQVIECGSTGIHSATRDTEGRFWIDGDWPSRPVLFRPTPAGGSRT